MAEANLVNANAVVEEAALQQAEVDLERTVIRAPIDGVILKRDVNAGQTRCCHPGSQDSFQIAQICARWKCREKSTRPMLVVCGWARRSDAVDAYPERVAAGSDADQVPWRACGDGRWFTLPIPTSFYLPGMTAVLRIAASDTGETLQIPIERFGSGPAAPVVGEKAASPGTGQSTATVWAIGSDGAPVAVNVALEPATGSTQALKGELHDGQRLIVGIATPQSQAGIFGLQLGLR